MSTEDLIEQMLYERIDMLINERSDEADHETKV